MINFCQVPIIGGFKYTKLEDHKSAFTELMYSFIISTLPLWGSLFAYILDNNSNESYTELFTKLIQNGELFIYSATTLAPVVYIVSKDRESGNNNESLLTLNNRFPNKHIFILFVIVISLVSAIMIAVQRFKKISLNDDLLVCSIIIYGVSLFILYVALVYNNMFDRKLSPNFLEGEESFVNEYKKHRS